MLSFKEYFSDLLNKQVIIVTDSVESFNFFEKKGYQVVDYKKFNDERCEKIFFIATDYNAFGSFLNKKIDCYILGLSLLKFDNTIECLEYSFDKLLNANINDSLATRKRYFSLINSSQEFSLKYDNRLLSIDTKGELVFSSQDIVMKKGVKYTVPELFEASFVSFGSYNANYNLNGVFAFQDITYVCRNDKVRSSFENSLLDLKAKLRENSNGNYLYITNNKVTDIEINNISYNIYQDYPLLEWGDVVEVAVGVNKHLNDINWDINSPMNEGVAGFHLGVGYGIDSPHIDFILHDKQFSLDFH